MVGILADGNLVGQVQDAGTMVHNLAFISFSTTKVSRIIIPFSA
jgi:hypothetical protein